METTTEWESSVKGLLQANKLIHFLGVGNPIRKDDGVGLFIASELRKKLGSRPNKLIRIYPNTFSPELLVSKVAKETGSLIVFDAVEHNSAPGSIIFAGLEDTKFGFFATHNVPFKLIPGLSTNLQNVFVLGIQPGNTDIGERLSEATLNSANVIVEKLRVLIKDVR